jgi:hypothetical protein
VVEECNSVIIYVSVVGARSASRREPSVLLVQQTNPGQESVTVPSKRQMVSTTNLDWETPMTTQWRRIAFLGTFAKLRKATFSFLMPLCPHGTPPLPLDGFSLNLIFEDYWKNFRENPGLINNGQE